MVLIITKVKFNDQAHCYAIKCNKENYQEILNNEKDLDYDELYYQIIE